MNQTVNTATPLELIHLRRDARTSLELAIAGLAPGPLIEKLASVTGYLEALAELPANSPPVIAMLPQIIQRTRVALAEWNAWHVKHLSQG